MTEFPSVAIRMSPELMRRLSKSHHGIRWEFTEPDADGFVNATVYLEPVPLHRRLWEALTDKSEAWP